MIPVIVTFLVTALPASVLLGVLLPELVVSIVLLLTLDAGLMQETGSIPLLAGLLEHLDRFNHLAPGHERDDSEDLAWPGLMGSWKHSLHSCSSYVE